MLVEIEKTQLKAILKDNMIDSCIDYMLAFGEKNARAVFQEAVEIFRTTQRK